MKKISFFLIWIFLSSFWCVGILQRSIKIQAPVINVHTVNSVRRFRATWNGMLASTLGRSHSNVLIVATSQIIWWAILTDRMPLCAKNDFIKCFFPIFFRKTYENTLLRAKNTPAVSCTNANCVKSRLNLSLQTIQRSINAIWSPFTRRKMTYNWILEK